MESRRAEILGPLLYVTPEEVPVRDLVRRAIESARGGVTGVVLRRKAATSWEFSELVRSFRDNVPRGLPWLVNRRLDFALAGGAAGLHLPEAHPPIPRIRPHLPDAFLLGASVHSLSAAEEAVREGADYLIAGPVFDTPSKRPFGPPIGVSLLEKIVASVSVPVFAIGGIGPQEAPKVRQAGAFGMAVMGALSFAPDPVASAFALRKAWARG
jgi:thiamine-phosphate pyrophosphorylase